MDLNRVTEFYQPAHLGELPKWQEGFAWLAGGTWLFSEPQPSVRGLIDLDTLLWPALQVLTEGLEIASTCEIAELEAFRAPSEWKAASLIPHCWRLSKSGIPQALEGTFACRSRHRGDDLHERGTGRRGHNLDS